MPDNFNNERRLIEAIITVTRQSKILASLADKRVKKSKEELADALDII